MKKLLFIIIAIFPICICAQDWTELIYPEFETNLTGFSSNDIITDLEIYNDEFIYICGYFTGILVIGDDTLTSKNSQDIFLAKYSISGSPLWAKSIGNNNIDYAFGIEIFSNGDAVIGGYYFGSISFGSNHLNATGNTDAYLAKIDKEGNWLWAESIGGSSYERGVDLDLDENENIYFTGTFQGSMNIEGNQLNSLGSNDLFVTYFDKDGNFQWINHGSSTGSLEPKAMVYYNNSCYIVGEYFEDSDFATHSISGNSNRDLFLVKINSLGFWRFARSMGSDEIDRVEDIFRVNNKLYLTGSFSSQISFGSTLLNSTGGLDIFVAEADTIGSFLWATKAGSDSEDEGKSIALRNGNLLVAGNFSNIASFGINDIVTNGNRDGFLAEIDLSGNWINAFSYGNNLFDEINNAKCDSQNNTYFSGNFEGNFEFGQNILASKGDKDSFLARIFSGNSASWIKHIFGAERKSEITDIETDMNANRIVIGNFYGTLNFDGSIINSAGNKDVFICKLDSNDNLLWVKAFGGNFDDELNGIATDFEGNIYVIGNFKERIFIENQFFDSKGLDDIIIAKFSPNGNLSWVRTAGGLDIDFGNGIICEKSSLYITGNYFEDGDFGNINLIGEGLDEIFVAKLDLNGSWKWAIDAGGADFDISEGIKFHNDNLFIYGNYWNQAKFGSKTLTSEGFDDLFIARMDTNGNFLRSVSAGSNWTDEKVNSLAFKDNNIFAAGNFSNAGIFGTDFLISLGENDGFLGQLNMDLEWQWVKSFGSSNQDEASDISIDSNGNLYLTGYYSSDFNYDTLNFQNLGKEDIFLFKTDSLGNIIWHSTAGGASSDRSNTLELTKDNNVLIGGFVSGQSGFDLLSLNNANELNSRAFYAINEFRPLPLWDVVDNTSSSSTVRIPKSINPSLGDKLLENGDVVGLFYRKSGKAECAGFGVWEDTDLDITVFGDDFSTLEKDGFSSGEKYSFLVWTKSNQKENYIRVRFGSGPDVYRKDSLSVVESMPAVWDTVSTQLRVGWNIVSANIIPFDEKIDSLLQYYTNDILLAKDGRGRIYAPNFGINDINNWNFLEGYQFYCTNPFELKLAGEFLAPEDHQLFLGPGWNIIAYLRDNEIPIEIALQSILNNILLVKDENGNIYAPDFGINDIINLQPMKGYQIYMKSNAILTYPAN